MDMSKALSWILIQLIIFHYGCICYGSASMKTCPPLPFVENGFLSMDSATVVKVVCDTSYRFYSEKNPGNTGGFIYCGKNGWTEPNPQCKRMTNHCLPPKSIENGQILQPLKYPKFTLIQYMCNEGHILKGPSERTCLPNPYKLEWSGSDPVCTKYDPSVIGDVAKHLDEQFVDKMEQYVSNASTGFGRNIRYGVEFEGLDLILMFDKSSSIHADDFKQGIDFAKFLVEKFNVSNGSIDKKGGTRIAVYTFGDVPKMEFGLEDVSISSTAKAKQKLDTIKCTNMCDGGTNMVDALALINGYLPKKARAGAKKALFITSDGIPTKGTSQNPIEYYTNSLKKKGVEIFAVGIGQDIDQEFLRNVADKPPQDHVFMLNEFSEFSKIVKIIREKTFPPPPPPITECGYISEKGKNNQINGTGKVNPGAWPWLAAIIKADRPHNGVEFGCTGVLICRQWVVAPAHCLYSNDGTLMEPEKIYVILGEDDLSVDSRHEQNFFASNIIVHAGYNPMKLNDKDIALIKLNMEATLGDYVRTACIPNQKEDHLTKQPGEEGSIAGWLITSEDSYRLSSGDITSLNASQTQFKIYGTDSCDAIKPATASCTDVKKMFAAGSTGLISHSACSGDSGSAFHRLNSKGRQLTFGLSVYSRGCSLNKKQMIFVPLANNQDWIRKNTKHCTKVHRTDSDE